MLLNCEQFDLLLSQSFEPDRRLGDAVVPLKTTRQTNKVDDTNQWQ